MFRWTTSRHAGSMTTSNEGERMSRIRNGILRRTNLIVLAFMFLGLTMAHAQESLEDLQKRKTIAEAEKEAIQAETARDEARKKQSELGAPLDPVKKAKDDAVEAANSPCHVFAIRVPFGISSSPHANRAPSRPPRAAYSHSASVGSFLPAHAACVSASSQAT